ncbi:hypothetical protein I552_2565 [Mycobacterium xenopi 3993]|nr:hypothetical protein I552_2565 [Mycobacterium xenopi 3993]
MQRCLDHRKRLGSNNSHVLITMQTKATRAAASDSYLKNTLRAVGIQPASCAPPAWSTSSAPSTPNSSPTSTA